MRRYVETIKLESGKIKNIELHNKRFNTTRKDLFGVNSDFDLSSVINTTELDIHSVYKCRVEYDQDIQLVEYIPYLLPNIQTLRVVVDNQINYPYKAVDRDCINKLKSKADGCDDILIIRNGLLTDTSFCNIALLKEGIWRTPDTPLLKGTKRAELIASVVLQGEPITVAEIPSFESIRLFNAMIEFGQITLSPADLYF